MYVTKYAEVLHILLVNLLMYLFIYYFTVSFMYAYLEIIIHFFTHRIRFKQPNNSLLNI